MFTNFNFRGILQISIHFLNNYNVLYKLLSIIKLFNINIYIYIYVIFQLILKCFTILAKYKLLLYLYSNFKYFNYFL